MIQRKIVVGAVVPAAALAVVVHAFAQADHTATPSNTTQVVAADAAPAWPADEAARFTAIPQQSNRLGAADAPVVIVVFEDLQCTVCRQFSMNAEHEMIDKLVATGKAKALLYPLTFVGPQSVTAASWAYGAAEQNTMWQFTDAFFANAGAENSGYATTDFLRRLSSTVPGLDVPQQERAAAASDARAFLSDSRGLAKTLNVNGTPGVYVGSSLSTLAPVVMTDITDYAAIANAVDAVATGRSVILGGRPAAQCSLQATVCSATPTLSGPDR